MATRDLRTLGSAIYDAVKAFLSGPWIANHDAAGYRLRNLGAPEEYDDASRKADNDAVAAVAASAATSAASATTAANSALTAATAAQTAADDASSVADEALLASLPEGGATGQFLVKLSSDNYDTQWIDGGSTAHASTHANGGSDEINVAGLSGVLADPQKADTLVGSNGNKTIGALANGEMLVVSGTSITTAAIPVGDITSVTAGAGLTGGGTSGAVTIAANVGTVSGTVAAGDDYRFTNARTPTAHAITHATGQSDALAPSDIGAASSARTISAGTGLTGGGDLTANRTLSVSYGTTAGTAAQGNDSRLSDARTPTSHAASHATGQSDAISPASIGAVATGDSRLSDDRTASGLRSATTVVAVSSASAPSAGQALVATSSTAASWQNVVATGDITAVIAGTGLTGGATSGDATVSVDFGTGTNQVRHGDDAAYTNARTPTAHASTHATGQSDAIAPSDIGAVPTTRTVSAGTGLSGGGDLSANRSLAVSFGTSGSTACVGNDARLSDDRTSTGLRTATTVVAVSTGAAPTAGQVLTATSGTAAQWSDPAGDITAVSAGTGLTGGGTSGSVSLAADFGTTSGKVTQGNDSRLSDDRTASGIRTATTTVAVSSATAPTSGQVLTATSGTAATWQTPTGGAATQIQESSGPTTLTVGAIADGQLTKRSGNTFIGVTANATLVGLANVTNDAQMKRAAGDYASFTSKGTPVSADILMIEDSAASNAKKSITVGTLPVAASQVSSGTLDMARVVGGSPTALQLLRVNSGGTALEAYTSTTVTSALTSSFTVTTSDQTLFSWDIPGAGTYQFDADFVVKITSTTSQSLTFTFLFSGTATHDVGRVRQYQTSTNSNITAQGGGTLGTATLTSSGVWTHNALGGTLFDLNYQPWDRWIITTSGTMTLSVKSSVTSIATAFSGLGFARKVA